MSSVAESCLGQHWVFSVLCVCLSVYVEISMSLCKAVVVYSQNPVVLMQSLSKRQLTLIIFKFVDICSRINRLFHLLHFLYILTQLHHCIYGSWCWMASLILVLVGIVLAEVEKTLVWSRPNARVFKVGWFWASQGSRHNDHISPWAELWWTCYLKGLLRDRGHTSTHPVREK